MEQELFTRYGGNPILTPKDWPYSVAAVFNPAATEFRDDILLLVRVEDMEGYSHLTIAKSKDGKTDWQIDSKPTLKADIIFNEAGPTLEDPRIVWSEEFEKYIITCVSFRYDVGDKPPGISIIGTKDFCNFERIVRPLIPPNKDACLFPKRFEDHFVFIHRPIVDGRADIWISFSKDLEHWGGNRVLLPARHTERSWDSYRVGLACPPIETLEGWLILFHGTRVTASGSLYRIGLALLDLENLKVIRRSKKWVLGPQEIYERVGNVDNIIFPCGLVVDEKTNEILLYYGAADTVVALATADLDEVLDYLMKCPEK